MLAVVEQEQGAAAGENRDHGVERSRASLVPDAHGPGQGRNHADKGRRRWPGRNAVADDRRPAVQGLSIPALLSSLLAATTPPWSGQAGQGERWTS